MVVFIYIPIFKQNEKRVRMKVTLRLEKHRYETINKQLLVNDHKKTASSQAGVLYRDRAVEKKEKVDQFEAKAISLNMASAGFFVTLISFFITIVQWWTHGWDSIAKSLLYVSIFLLAFSCWLPYSKWVEDGSSLLRTRLSLESVRFMSGKSKRLFVKVTEGLLIYILFIKKKQYKSE